MSRPSMSFSRSSAVMKGTNRYAPYRPSPGCSNLATLSATTTTAGETWREVCLQVNNDNFPDFKPRNDFDIFVLATTKYYGDRAKLETWLDQKLAVFMRGRGNLEAVMEQFRGALALPSDTITGLKPRESRRDVFLRPIPNSSYSIRLFPGSLTSREYCLDFVDSKTGTPVNSPFKFELCSAPNPSLQWIDPTSMRIPSLESMFGYSKDEIPPGQEKFVLRDGQTCLLKRPGHKDVRFTVPVRRQPLADTVKTDEVDELDLPESVVS